MYCILMERMHFLPAGFNNLADFQLLFQHVNESSARMRTQGTDLGADEDILQEQLSFKVLQPGLKMDITRLTIILPLIKRQYEGIIAQGVALFEMLFIVRFQVTAMTS